MLVSSNHPSTPTTGWLVELAGASPDAPLFLSVSTAEARFGWTHHADRALMLVREEDAEVLARYAQARAKAGTTTAPRKVEWGRESTELERENARLRRRIDDLETILTALRRIRAADIERATEESQSTDETEP